MSDLSRAKTPDLLRMYSDLLNELTARDVIRSRNAPAGDLAEKLVGVAYGGTLAPPSQTSWDVLTPDGRQLQVKCRLTDPDRPRGNYSVFRSWDFDACVFVQLTHQYAVSRAVEVPVECLRSAASRSEHVNGWRIQVRSALAQMAGAQDVTAMLESAYSQL